MLVHPLITHTTGGEIESAVEVIHEWLVYRGTDNATAYEEFVTVLSIIFGIVFLRNVLVDWKVFILERGGRQSNTISCISQIFQESILVLGILFLPLIVTILASSHNIEEVMKTLVLSIFGIIADACDM